MEEKLQRLYFECLEELEKIGIIIKNNEEIGQIDISISKRNNKRYGACRQEEPDKTTKYTEVVNGHRYIRYAKYKKHMIEVSPWVMEMDDKIIKNTIMHELIHCMPYCNNHGNFFKAYAKNINKNLGYDVSRVGNKEEDYKKSGKEYKEQKIYNYKIICEGCGQVIYRQRYNKDFTKKYRCGKCGGKFKAYKIIYKTK